MAFKENPNCGVSQRDLERGYSNTGGIPDIGDSISNADAEMRKDQREAREMSALAEKFDWGYDPPRSGFLGVGDDGTC